MANQSTSDKQDRNGGGDVTKSEVVATPEVPKTVRNFLNESGPGRFSSTGDE